MAIRGTPKRQRSRQMTPLDWLQAQLGKKPTDAGLWYGKGVLLVKEGELESAIKCFDNALWADPEHLKALEGKGKALFRLERHLEAYDAFKRLARKVPRDETFWYFCGECLTRLGTPAKAVTFYDIALEIDPNYTDSLYARGEALKGMEGVHGEGEGSPGTRERGISKAKDSAIEEILTRAETSMYTGNYEDSLELYDSVLEKSPGETRAWEGKGMALARLSRFSEAAECYERAIRGRPGEPSLELERARALREGGQAEEAARSLAEVLKVQPGNVEAALELAEISREREGGEAVTAPAPDSGPEAARFVEQDTYSTYIQPLDSDMEGGITPGSIVLVSGKPGTYKTSLCFWILYQQAVREGRKGLYITIEQSKGALIRHLLSLGLDPGLAVGSLRILDLGRYRKEFWPKDSPQSWISILEKKVQEVRGKGVEAIALDSLDALASLAAFENRRHDILQLFNFLRDIGVTSFIVTERQELEFEGGLLRAYDVQDFLSDGIFELSLKERGGGEPQRLLRVEKMRDRPHPSAYQALLWDGGFRVTKLLSATVQGR